MNAKAKAAEFFWNHVYLYDDASDVRQALEELLHSTVEMVHRSDAANVRSTIDSEKMDSLMISYIQKLAGRLENLSRDTDLWEAEKESILNPAPRSAAKLEEQRLLMVEAVKEMTTSMNKLHDVLSMTFGWRAP